MEILVTLAVMSVLFVGLFSTMRTEASMVVLCRDNQAATRILAEKLDAIRLYNWQQLTSNNFVPTNFTVNLDPGDPSSRPYYTGVVSIVSPAPISERYKSNLAQVTVTLKWQSGKRPEKRSMVSYVTKYGLSRYINR